MNYLIQEMKELKGLSNFILNKSLQIKTIDLPLTASFDLDFFPVGRTATPPVGF